MHKTALVLLFIIAIALFIIGLFLFNHRNRPFFIFHPEKEHGLHVFCTYFGGFVLFCATATIIAVFIDLNALIFPLLLVDALCAFIIPFVLWAYTL